MSALENARHEEFAQLIARGIKQGEAYQRAGYSENKGAASRLAASIPVQDRVAEIRRELKEKAQQVATLKTEEIAGSLEEMGLTMTWVAEQFRNIYEEALTAGAFGPANSAVENIKKLIEAEKNAKPNEEESAAPRFNMQDMLGVLDKVADVITAAKGGEAPVMLDITPKDS